MTTRVLTCLSALALSTTLLSGSAWAGFVASQDGVSFYLNGDFPDEHESKVFLDKTPNGTHDNLVTGNVGSQTGTPAAQFQSVEDVVAGSGFANIKGDTGDFSQIEFRLDGGFTFTDLLFDVQLATTKDSNDVINVADQLQVRAFFADGSSSTVYSDWLSDPAWKNGFKADNSLMVIADTGLALSSVLISTWANGQLVAGLFEVKHFQVSGCTLDGGENECDGGGGGGNPVPIPGALPLMMSGIAGLGYLARRRRVRNA